MSLGTYSSSSKYLGGKNPISLNSTVQEPFQSVVADIIALFAAFNEGAEDPDFDDITCTTLSAIGIILTTDATDSTSGATGSIHTAGGIGAIKNIFSGANVTATGELIAIGDGDVSEPAVKIGTTENGFYEVSATQLGVTVGDTLVAMFDSNGLVTSTISEQIVGVGVTIDGVLLKDNTATVTQVIEQGVASTEGFGLMTLKSKSSSIAFSGGGTEVIPVAVPEGVVLVAAQIRNDTILTATTGVSYSAAYSTGASQAISSGTDFTKNTKVSTAFDVNAATPITTGTTDITLTPNAGTLDTGTVTAVVYYYELTDLTDAD